MAGYLAAMLINPNNHALDGGPATGQMEKEAVALLAAMFGLDTHLGHLTTSGTIANLEALYVAREIHPGRGVAYSEEAHYTHARMCGVLGIEGTAVPADGAGRMDPRHSTRCSPGAGSAPWSRPPARPAWARSTRCTRSWRWPAGTAPGCTWTRPTAAFHAAGPGGPGAPLRGPAPASPAPGPAACPFPLRSPGTQAGRPIASSPGQRGPGASLDPAPWRAIAGCDSVVVDPHKHGLQPYGCGAVLFKDPDVGRFYLHDSPYTYFTSDELHLGEISLECSRAGASAAALWLTLQLLPPTPDGLGRVLAACRRAALDWAALIGESGLLRLYQPPELDIVCYFPHLPAAAMSGIDEASVSMLARGMKQDRPVFLSTLRVTAAGLSRRHPGIKADRDGTRILRSVLMKPEAHGYLGELHARVEALAAQALAAQAEAAGEGCHARVRGVAGRPGGGGHRCRDRDRRGRGGAVRGGGARVVLVGRSGPGRCGPSRRRWGSGRWPCPATRRPRRTWRSWPRP